LIDSSSSNITLPPLALGSSGIRIPAEARSRGLLVDGQPGAGKSTFLVDLLAQDASHGIGGVILDPHDLADHAIAHFPDEAEKRVVVLDLRDEAAPAWPLVTPAVGGDEEERLLAAEFLAAAWRSEWGEESVGPRAEYLLRNALMLAPPGSTPLELMALLADVRYRRQRLNKLNQLLEAGRAGPSGFGLSLGWSMNMNSNARSEELLRSWSQAVENKLQPLLLHPWARRAVCGFPPLRRKSGGGIWDRCPVVPASDVDRAVHGSAGGGLRQVTWLGGGWVSVTMGPTGATSLAVADMSEWLTALARRESQRDEAIPVRDDVARQHLKRRLMRAGWQVWASTLEWRGVSVREVVDLPALVDEGKLVFVSASTARGEFIARFIAVTTLLKLLLRGLRLIDLPPELRTPAVVYVDEARLYVSASIDRLLAELRKANSGLVMAVQSLEQLGELKTVLVNMAGGLISMTSGFQEDVTWANLTGEQLEAIRDLGRGQGLVSVLDDDWKKTPPRIVNLTERSSRGDPERAQRVRERSRLRYTIPIAEAETWAGLRERAIDEEERLEY
jgi:hypothetical protein